MIFIALLPGGVSVDGQDSREYGRLIDLGGCAAGRHRAHQITAKKDGQRTGGRQQRRAESEAGDISPYHRVLEITLRQGAPGLAARRRTRIGLPASDLNGYKGGSVHPTGGHEMTCGVSHSEAEP